MAYSANDLFPTAAIARELSGQIGSGDVSLRITVDNAINTAIGVGLFTTTASVSGLTSQNIQNVMEELKNMGYTVTIASTTMTVSWF